MRLKPSLKNAVNANYDDILKLPKKSGCYAFFNNCNHCVYVGMSVDLRKRCLQHWRSETIPKISKNGFICFWLSNRQQILERKLIHFLNPLLNKERYYIPSIQTKWDGSFSYPNLLGKISEPKNGYHWRKGWILYWSKMGCYQLPKY